MAGGRDTDGRDDSWLWEDKSLRDQVLRELRDQEDELQRRGGINYNNNNSPFSAFKKFVDSNINALQSAFREFPSNVAEIRAKMQREQERIREEEMEISRRWTGSSDTPDHIQMELLRSCKVDKQDAHAATVSLLAESARRNAHVPPDKIQALYEDHENTLGELDRLVNPMLALGGALMYMPETGDKLPVGQDAWRWLAPSPRWLSVDWFKRSPYSPVRLEAHPDLERDGAKWRAAFEDLLNASLGKPMDSGERVGVRDLYGKPQSTYYGPGLEWMLSLQCRGILPPQLPRTYNEHSARRALPSDSIVGMLRHIRTDLPWSSDHSLAWHSSTERDFSDLMSEIATKSTSETEVDEDSLSVERFCQPRQLPITLSSSDDKNDLEDESEEDEEFEDDELGFPWNMVVFENAHRASHLALDIEDSDFIRGVLDLWHKNGQDAHILITKLLHDLCNSGSFDIDEQSKKHDVLIEAIRLSNLPQAETWRRVFESYGGNQKRKILEAWLSTLSHRPTDWSHLTEDELAQTVERLMPEIDRVRCGEQTGKRPAYVLPNDEVDLPPSRQETPGVLSALTTTQTTRMPDGTVTTKVVLRKRFVDGREEITESVHTSNENLEQQQKQIEEEEKPPKKTGWFWS